MRVLTHKRRAQWLSIRPLILAVALMGFLLVGVFALIIALVIAFVPAASDSPFLLVAMAAASVIIGLRIGSLMSRRILPHTILEAALKGLGAESRLYNYWLPANHVLIGPQGIFTLTPYDGKNPLIFAEGVSSKEAIRLLERARADAQRTQAWLSDRLAESATVQPVIVLTNPRASFVAEGALDIPVLYADKRKPSLKAYVRSQALPTLSAEVIAQLDKALRIPSLPD